MRANPTLLVGLGFGEPRAFHLPVAAIYRGAGGAGGGEGGMGGWDEKGRRGRGVETAGLIGGAC